MSTVNSQVFFLKKKLIFYISFLNSLIHCDQGFVKGEELCFSCDFVKRTLSALDICREFDFGDDTSAWGKSTRETADIQFLLQLSK